MTAGNDAAISRGSCQASRIVSTNTWTVMKPWLTTSGSASVSSSRLPPWRGESGGTAAIALVPLVGPRGGLVHDPTLTHHVVLGR